MSNFAPHSASFLSCAALKEFSKARVRESLDIGDAQPCPDFSRPDECTECFLKEDGTHWPYCSKFVKAVAPPRVEQTFEERVADVSAMKRKVRVMEDQDRL